MRWLVFILSLFSPGCLYALVSPVCTETPALACPHPDVRAFLATTEDCYGRYCTLDGRTKQTRLEEIPLHLDTVPPRSNFPAWYCIGFWLMHGEYERYKEVRLYRPGYETIVIPADMWAWWRNRLLAHPQEINWKEAADLAAQEKALEVLAGGPTHHTGCKEAAELLAWEYCRLAQSPMASGEGMQKKREELLEIAATIARFAGGEPIVCRDR